jgi:ubiquinone biosynthesis protein UbiJ
MAVTTQMLRATLNHLITAEPWAGQQLASHAGKLIALRLAPFAQSWLAIQVDGSLADVIPGEAQAALTVTVPATRALLTVGDRAALEQAMQFEGDAELEQAMRALVRSLRWDLEEDLSKWVGDAAAHRIANGGRRAREWTREGMARAGQNVGEYLSEERRLVVSQVQLAGFAEDLRQCDQRLQALEQRIGALEQRLRGPV